MDYAALVSLAQTIDIILNYHQNSASPKVKNQITSIHEYVIFLQSFLVNFPDEANRLEGRIRELAYVAESMIESLLSELILESRYASLHSNVGPSKTKVKHPVMERGKHLPRGNRGDLRFYFHELKEVTKEIESIAEKVMEIKRSIKVIKDVPHGGSTTASSSSRVAKVHKDAMVGFDKELTDIISRLCGGSPKREVIPIVGMGGIGKTTLARTAYDHPLIVEHFDICAWVTLAQDYRVQEIVSCLLDFMKVPGAKNNSREAHHVYQNLKERRYLIVLDDIWSTKAWDDLQMMFPDDDNGSRIILTTRLLDVASYPDSSSPLHEMRLMNEDESWNLLRQKVFKQGPCPLELVYVGKVIARSCKGLPLAIVVISGLLAVHQTKVVWGNIAKDVKSVISANDEQFDKMLSLSYAHLPLHLKPCFLYMGGFPEDYEMSASKLIKQWVAEGFLKPNGCNKSLEETAEEYLEDLVKRYLVLVRKRKSDGRIKSCSMHDLMREMCRRKAQEEKFILHVRGFLPDGMKIPPRLCIFHNGPEFLQNVRGSLIRTIIWLKHHPSWPWYLRYVRLLRILDLSDAHEFVYTTDSSSLPDNMFELFHLRYLACNSLLIISADISKLQNLQTLIIGPKTHHAHLAALSVTLPVEIWRMAQLRHLVGLFSLLPFQEGAAVALENLQTLMAVRNFICSPRTLKMFPNLKKLGLCYSKLEDEDIYEGDYQLHNLIYLQRLENLKLGVHSDFRYPENINPAFPKTLKKLTLSGLGLPWEDMTVVGSLPNLEVLKLKDYACVGNTWETTEEEFSQLKFLMISDAKLQHWITESSHFPRLKRLQLRGCQYLGEIPYGIGEIPTLELIEVSDTGSSGVGQTDTRGATELRK